MRDQPISRRPGRRLPRPVVMLFALGVLSCGEEREAKSTPAVPATRPLLLGSTVPILDSATVVAFWLSASDSIPEATRRAAREEFQEQNRTIADYLADTDIGLIATVNDTVVIQLPSGIRRTVMLSGLDYPYGFVLIEPGYAEEFHTGFTRDEDIRASIDDYFGLEDESSAPKHRIASLDPEIQRTPVQPGPRRARPGFAPVCTPSRSTGTPFTRT